jgi:YHS domain-containing protein
MRATDVVCGKRIDAMLAMKDHRTSEHKGEVFYFCSQHCLRTFEASPAQFLVPIELLTPIPDMREFGHQYANS